VICLDEDIYKGYRGAAKNKLQEFKIKVWSDVIINSTRGTFKGIILPRAETEDDQHIVLKLHNGYNVGIKINSIKSVKEIGYKKGNYKIPESEFPVDIKKPNVTLLELVVQLLLDLIIERELLYLHFLQANYMVQSLNLQIFVI
jgi:glutamyl-tRNA(Gln) amidotransferase subunit D